MMKLKDEGLNQIRDKMRLLSRNDVHSLLKKVGFTDDEWQNFVNHEEVDDTKLAILYSELRIWFTPEQVEKIDDVFIQYWVQKYNGCMFYNWSKNSELLKDNIAELTHFIELITTNKVPDNGITLTLAKNNKMLLDIYFPEARPNQNGFLCCPKLIFNLFETYTKQSHNCHETQQLTPSGRKRICSAIDNNTNVNWTLHLSSEYISAQEFADMMCGRAVDSTIIYKVFKIFRIKLDEDCLLFPIKQTDYQTQTQTTDIGMRNKAIIESYKSGSGLRLLQEKFGLSQSGIRKILEKASVYRGAELGKKRHALGGWNNVLDDEERVARMRNSKNTKTANRRINLQNKRLDAKMSQQQIATMLECSKSYYCAVENARENPSEAFWTKVEVLFSLEPNDTHIRLISASPSTYEGDN